MIAAAVAGPQANMIPSPAADMWSLGVLGFEMMSGQPLFGTQYSNNDVIAMLLGYDFSVCQTCMPTGMLVDFTQWAFSAAC